MHSAPKSWKELRDELRALGATAVRTKGSHQTWRFYDGTSFTVVCNHLNDPVPVGILVRFRRLRSTRGATDDEPAPLGPAGPRWSRPDSSEHVRWKAG